jgi:hypothetical protein
MSKNIAGFIILMVASLIPFVLGYIVRKRGGAGWINGVNWDRVSDVEGCSRFASNRMYVLGLILVSAGAGTLLLDQHPEWRPILGVLIAVAVVANTLILILGLLRYQDKPPASRKPNGRR